MLTIIGSSNFGYRSVYRDVEAQIIIFTKNSALQDELHKVLLTLI
jgi:CDP-diacylglycerol--glycerol-3-phosphate 3-phosphatidyltransferase